MQRILSLSFAVFCLLITACTSNTGGVDEERMALDFDRQAMLATWADDVILPALTGFQGQLAELHAAIENIDPNAAAQNEETAYLPIRSAHQTLYLRWQQLSPFMVGKAEELRLREQSNTYPANTEMVTESILSQTYNLELPSMAAAQGLPALDYIINNTEASFNLLGNEAENGPQARAYALALVERMNDLTTNVLNDWNGGFRDAYVMNDGNSATASIDRTVNDYIFYFEKFFRAGKVGIPAGVFSDTPLPDRVESLYGGNAAVLFDDAFSNTRSFFADNGLADYLDALNVSRDGELLSTKINAQFQEIETAAANVSNFKETIETDNIRMLTLYDELQKMVVLLKVDMLQALSINVDYVDADGD